MHIKMEILFILEHPAVWYTTEGGITALDIMLQGFGKHSFGVRILKLSFSIFLRSGYDKENYYNQQRIWKQWPIYR